MAQFVLCSALLDPGNPHSFEKARLADLVAGTAYRPFVFRAAFPAAVGLVERILPAQVKHKISSVATGHEPVRRFLEKTPAAEEAHATLYAAAYFLEFLSLLGFALVVRSLAVNFYNVSGWTADLIGLGALVPLPVFCRYIAYDYDYPNLFLFALTFLFLRRRAWGWYYPSLLVAALSKETSVLLVLIHLLGHHATMTRRALFIHAGVSLAIVIAGRVFLQIVFAENPGAPLEFWLDRNLDMLTDPARWRFLFFHFTWVGGGNLIIPTNFNVLFLLLLPLIFWRWAEKPLFLRRALWITPVPIVLALFFGYLDELRGYYEQFPIIYLLGIGTVLLSSQEDGRVDHDP